MNTSIAVTGVASGIGAAIAAKLKANGCRVIGFDVHPTSENVDEFVALDLNDPASIADAAGRVKGPLNGLCNNAGLPPRAGLQAKILQVNFLGQRAFTEAMLPHLSQGASIVNMASRAGAKWAESIDQNKRLAAITGTEALAEFIVDEQIDPTRCYNLSKEAMILWSQALNEPAMAKGMRVNSVSPGAVATGILDDFAAAFGEKMARNVARAGRPGTAEEIASVAVFLLSDQSAWIKGVDVPVDGGMGAFNLSDAMGLDAMR